MGACLQPSGNIAAVRQTATTNGIVLCVVAMAAFAIMDGIGKHLTGTYPVHQILWIRYGLFLTFAFGLARHRGFRRTVATHHLRLHLIRSLVLVFESGTFVLSFKFLPLADTHAIAASAPLIVTALAIVFLNERVGLRRWTATLIGFFGVLVIIRPGLGVFDPVAILPVIAAVLFAVYQIMTRMLANSDSAETTLFYTGVVGFAVLTLVVPFGWQWPTPIDWSLLFLVGVLGSGAHWVLILALRAAPASLLQPYTYALVLFATAVGFVGFGDIPDSITILGGAIVIGSGLYTLQRENLRTSERRARLPG